MKKGYIVLIVIAVVVLSIFFWFKGAYNGMVNMREAVSAQWSNVENQYQRRLDLIPNLVNTVKGYASHEENTLTEVVNARAKATQMQLNIDQLDEAALKKLSKIKFFYTYIRKKFIYSFNEQLLKVNEEIEDLNLLSIIKGFGGNIVDDSYELCLKDDLIYFSKQIYNNLDLWNKHKQKLYDKSIFLHEENNPEIINIDYSRIEDEERNLLDLILNKMKEMNEIAFSKNNDKVKVRFLNNYIKGFIFKSGTWLEIATNNLLKNIKEIDECRNGVIFLWNNGRKTVRNELDVIAVKDSVPICISCKDSDKYNEMALNELNVYANKIGGKNAYKILVATKEPIKEPVKMRAKEMGIHLVIFDGNEEKFINKIRKIIINDELSK